MKLNFLNGFLMLLVALAFFSCRENDFEKMRENELRKLAEYIKKNHEGAEPLNSGLYFFHQTEGTGDSVNAGDLVQVYYSVYNVDSLLLDETDGYSDGYRYDPYEFVVGTEGTIQGLQQAVTFMREGGVANLVIPSELAYKQNGTVGIAGFTTLVMQVELYRVYPAGTQ